MNRRKVCIATGTRAEFGLLYWLIDAVHRDPDMELQLIVTGMHLSPEFGMTVNEIEKSPFPIAKKIEILLSSDSPVGVAKSVGLGVISFAEAFAELQPVILVVLGDRFEMLSVATAALIARIPIGHIHGGETTEGVIDEAIRHAITKMSHLHFTATETYRNRVIQLGESPDRVFNTGTPGLDNIEKMDLLDRPAFEAAIDFSLGTRTALVTFHPVTLEKQTAVAQFSELLAALEDFPEMSVIFTMPNADTDGRGIMELIHAFVAQAPAKRKAFSSLGQLRYLSALAHVDVVIGNSSSGLTEVPSFRKPTVNIGDRQKGRLKAASVIDCLPLKETIGKAIEHAFSEDLQQQLATIVNPYGQAGASEKIKEIIQSVDLNGILKKQFYDVEK